MRRLRWIKWLSVAFIGLALGGCGGGGNNPPSPVTLTSITAAAANPAGVAGTTVQLSATGTYSNGTTQNLTGSVTWASSNQDVATINSAGLATGTGPGTAKITATSGAISGSTDLTMTTPVFSGTAAAGLPLTGTVTVKDALDATKTVPIGANGSYSVDVWGMTPPLMLRAEGNVGSTTYVIHSATAEIGAGGTLNITPLTDLIIDNIAGQLARDYFDSGNFADLTKAALDAESAALKAKLLPVLQAMEVDASIDLLRTPFTPLASALDAALDIIRISVDPATHIATIANLVNQIAITDDIAVPAADETDPPVLSGDGTAAAADDLPLIRKAVTDFIDLYDTGLPQPASILALLSEDFLHDDTGPADFANEVATDTELVAGSFTDIVVSALDYNYHDGATPLAFVGFTVRNADGIELDPVRAFSLIREDGRWLLHGNRHALEIDAHVSHVNDSRSGCRAGGFGFGIQDTDTSNSSTIGYVLVDGPGLPEGGLKYERSLTGDDWRIVNPGGNPFWYPLTGGCSHYWGDAGVPDDVIAAIPDNASYVVRAFTSDGAEVPIGPYGTGVALLFPKRPLTLAELDEPTRFPSFTTSVDLQSYTGGEITINGTGADPTRSAWAYLGLTANGLLNSIDADVIPAGDGTFSHTLSLSNPGGVITAREVRVGTEDAYGRDFTSSATYGTVGGTITGLTGTGLSLRLNNGIGPAANVSPRAGDTTFNFPWVLEPGAQYGVSIVASPANPSQFCFATSAFGTVGGSPINVSITCLNSAPYSASGSVNGLTGAGLALRTWHTDISFVGGATTSDDLDVAAGSDAFEVSIPANNTFNIGILGQPAGQTCTITHALGFSLGDEVPGVGIECLDNTTDPLSGTYSFLNEAGRSYLNFNTDGIFTTAMIHTTPPVPAGPGDCGEDSDPHNDGNGVEYGVFTWDESTGLFHVVALPVVDTNGECGLADDEFPTEDFNIVRDDNGIVLMHSEGVIALTALESNPGTLIGAWVPEANNGELLVFHADGTFLWAETQGHTNGQERGCYTVSGSVVTLTIAASCLPDGFSAYDLNDSPANGAGGLLSAGVTTRPAPFTFEDPDTLFFFGRRFVRTQPND